MKERRTEATKAGVQKQTVCSVFQEAHANEVKILVLSILNILRVFFV